MVRLFALIVACVCAATSGFQTSLGSRVRSHGMLAPKRIEKSTISPISEPTVSPLSTTASNDDKSVPGLPKWDPVNWTPKRLHNTPLFRSAAILAALAAAGYSAGSPLAKISIKAAATVHLFSFATWFGTMAYTTFILGITMFKNLPRRTFGKVQSKLFPKYFNLCAATILLQVLTLQKLPTVLSQKSTVALGTALVTTLINLFLLEPQSTKNMFERYELEDIPGAKDSEKYKKLASSFGKLHGMSSLVNLVSLCGAVAHGYYLASALAV